MKFIGAASLLPAVGALMLQPQRSFMTTTLRATDEPSTSDVGEAAAPEKEAEVMNTLSPKEELMSVVAASSPGSSMTADLRASTLETLMKLEPTNPTEAPATSPLLNGVWDVVYSGYAPGPLASPTRPLALFLYAGGFTPGVAGLSLARMLPESLADVGELSITIQREQPRAEASTTVALAGMGPQTVKVQTSLEAESAVRIKETYLSASAFGRDVEIPSRLRYSRLIYVTYLDDEILVVRDESGVPEVLLRKSMPDFLDEGVPSSDEDDVAPGAG